MDNHYRTVTHQPIYLLYPKAIPPQPQTLTLARWPPPSQRSNSSQTSESRRRGRAESSTRSGETMTMMTTMMGVQK